MTGKDVVPVPDGETKSSVSAVGKLGGTFAAAHATSSYHPDSVECSVV